MASRQRNRASRPSILALPMMTVVVVAALSGLVVSCGDAAPVVAVDDPVLEQGRDLYIRNCAGCHGLSGGGASGPALDSATVTATFPAAEDQITVVTEGRDRMPSFNGRLSAEEIEAVVRYTREVL